MSTQITWIDEKPYALVSRLESVDEPTNHARRRCGHFRTGQRDRKAGKPCISTNGAYLDGWYSPDLKTPPYVSPAQAAAFKL